MGDAVPPRAAVAIENKFFFFLSTFKYSIAMSWMEWGRHFFTQNGAVGRVEGGRHGVHHRCRGPG